MKYRFILFALSCALAVSPAKAQLQQIMSIAGNGETGYSGDGGVGVAAMLSAPLGLAVDAKGTVYIQDVFNNRVRKLSVDGQISTFAGDGTEGYSGDGTIANSGKIMPTGLAADKQGNVYIADASHSVIRKVNTLGILSTFAGSGSFGHTGDGGPATAAQIGNPYGMAIDTFGNLYFADAGMNVVRKVNKAGIISTVAGNDIAGYSGDGGQALLASLDSPYSVAVDLQGNVFISDFFNDVIRKVDGDHVISTYAGIQGMKNYFGDGGMATDAHLNRPRGIAVDNDGNVYIADAENNVIRKVEKSGKISTVVGNGTLGYGGDGGYSLSANLHNPYGVAVDKFGTIYVADANNQRIRKSYNPYLAVNTVNKGAAIALYPTPCTNKVTLSGVKKTDIVVVYDMAGRMVSNTLSVAKDGEESFDVKGLAAGTYMLHVADASGNSKANVKMVKQ